MSKEQKITNNIKVPNKDLETLKIHFPHCFDKDGNFQLEKFKSSLSENEINFSTESYGLDWLGKSYARLLASDPATTLLKADETHNSKPENANSENLLIKGDNLEVLKHLVGAYYEKIKMIYIDPPYNTGSDGFVYEDDRKFTVKELQNLIGIDEEKAKRILDFTQSKSNSHSAWLTFMYPRLYIAKQLLKDDGVIFVSIDDNEVAQLRLLMDEIFGEENFLSELVRRRRKTQANLATHIAPVHEYVIVYVKNKASLSINKLPYTKEFINQNFSNPDNDPRGVYQTGPLARPESSTNPEWELTLPNSRKITARWSCSPETYEKYLSENRLVVPRNGEGMPRIKIFLSELDGQLPNTWLDDVASNDEASTEIENLFGSISIFTSPKPTGLIKRLAQLGTSKKDIILDFFAGSGTTGDAVMQINAEDGGNRKYILVQLPEAINPKKSKAAYDFVKNELKAEPTVFEITKERLLRAAGKINAELDMKIEKLKAELPTEENKAEIEKLEHCKAQNCFKIFETTPIWEDYNFEAEQFDSSQTLFDVGKLSEDDIKALLITWKTYDDIPLTQDLENVNLSSYTAYYGNGRLYLMNKGFTTDSLKALLEKIDTDKHFEPKSIIAFGYHLESKSLREISENVKTYNNKKKSDIDFITRY
jgi:adenine-specific DNA-methyltransferase